MTTQPISTPTAPPTDKVTFASGAERGTQATRGWHMLSQIALRRYCDAMQEGSTIYKPYNWLKGIPVTNQLEHLYTHLSSFLQGDSTEDHLGHALWNLAAIIHYSETRLDLFDGLPPGCKEGMIEFLENSSSTNLPNTSVDHTSIQPESTDPFQDMAGEDVEMQADQQTRTPFPEKLLTDPFIEWVSKCANMPLEENPFYKFGQMIAEKHDKTVLDAILKSTSGTVSMKASTDIKEGDAVFVPMDDTLTQKNFNDPSVDWAKVWDGLQKTIDRQTRHIREVERWNHVLKRERDELNRLRTFKTWVHKYLDCKGIPTNPGGPHTDEGCRIGDRLDYFFNERFKRIDEQTRHIREVERWNHTLKRERDDLLKVTEELRTINRTLNETHKELHASSVKYHNRVVEVEGLLATERETSSRLESAYTKCNARASALEDMNTYLQKSLDTHLNREPLRKVK